MFCVCLPQLHPRFVKWVIWKINPQSNWVAAPEREVKENIDVENDSKRPSYTVENALQLKAAESTKRHCF